MLQCRIVRTAKTKTLILTKAEMHIKSELFALSTQISICKSASISWTNSCNVSFYLLPFLKPPTHNVLIRGPWEEHA